MTDYEFEGCPGWPVWVLFGGELSIRLAGMIMRLGFGLEAVFNYGH